MNLPPLPEHCRKQIKHARYAVGDQAISVLKREIAALDEANIVIKICADNYDNVKKSIAGEPAARLVVPN